jgi:hypothetical protein
MRLTVTRCRCEAGKCTCTTELFQKGISAVNHLDKIEPHARTLESAADAMEKDGIGSVPVHGHASVLRHMAACMRADAAQGRMPSAYHGIGSGLSAAAEPAHLNPATVAILGQLGV